MATVQLKLGPADQGRALSLDEYESADYVPGFKYEIIDGRLYVSPAPNFPESFLESWLVRKLDRHMGARPDVINYVANKPRVFVRKRRKPTVPEPDIAAYHDLPLDQPIRSLHWRDLGPILVVEVLVEGDIYKDLSRNPELYHRVPSIKEYWVLNGSEAPDEPSLIQHRRRGKAWTVTTFPYDSTFTTRILPGFSLVIDPRK
jgi:Uma2 family endonuclease